MIEAHKWLKARKVNCALRRKLFSSASPHSVQSAWNWLTSFRILYLSHYLAKSESQTKNIKSLIFLSLVCSSVAGLVGRKEPTPRKVIVYLPLRHQIIFWLHESPKFRASWAPNWRGSFKRRSESISTNNMKKKNIEVEQLKLIFHSNDDLFGGSRCSLLDGWAQLLTSESFKGRGRELLWEMRSWPM